MTDLELALQELIDNPRKNDPYWYLEVCDIYRELKLYEKAVLLLEEAIKSGIDDDFIKLNYAISLRNIYKYNEAILILEDFEKDYEDQTAVRNLIFCYSRIGRFEEAIDEALELERNVGFDEWIGEELAFAYLNNSQLDEGKNILHRILELNENNIWAIRQLGLIYHQKSNGNDEFFTMAIEYLSRVYNLEPDSNLSSYDYGNICSKALRYNEALTYYLKALELTEPSDLLKEEIIEKIAITYFMLQEFEEAYDYFNKLYNENEVNIEYPKIFIDTLIYLTKYEEALEFCSILTDVNKYEKSFINIMKCYVYHAMDDNDKALQLVEETYQDSPNNEVTLEYIIKVLSDMDELDIALNILKDYLTRNKETLITDNLHQNLYYSLDNYKDAIPYLLKLNEIEEDKEETNYKLSYSYYVLNDLESAIKYALLVNDIENKITLLDEFKDYKDIIKCILETVDYQNNSYLLEELAKAYNNVNDNDNAIKYALLLNDIVKKIKLLDKFYNYKDIIKCILETDDYQNNSFLLEELGRAYNNVKDYDNAIKTLDKIYEENKENSQFLYVYAYALEGNDNHEEALTTVNKSIDLSSKYDNKYRMNFLKGEILRKLKKYDEALKYLNMISGTDFEDEDTFYEFALLYQDMNKNDLALNNYKIIEEKYKFTKVIAESYANLLSKLDKEDEAKKYRELALTLNKN